MTILQELSSTQLTEILCLVCIILYDTKVQDKGIPHYVPEPYTNRSQTSDLRHGHGEDQANIACCLLLHLKEF